jgi:hypothetical protein
MVGLAAMVAFAEDWVANGGIGVSMSIPGSGCVAVGRGVWVYATASDLDECIGSCPAENYFAADALATPSGWERYNTGPPDENSGNPTYYDYRASATAPSPPGYYHVDISVNDQPDLANDT